MIDHDKVKCLSPVKYVFTAIDNALMDCDNQVKIVAGFISIPQSHRKTGLPVGDEHAQNLKHVVLTVLRSQSLSNYI